MISLTHSYETSGKSGSLLNQYPSRNIVNWRTDMLVTGFRDTRYFYERFLPNLDSWGG